MMLWSPPSGLIANKTPPPSSTAGDKNNRCSEGGNGPSMTSGSGVLSEVERAVLASEDVQNLMMIWAKLQIEFVESKQHEGMVRVILALQKMCPSADFIPFRLIFARHNDVSEFRSLCKLLCTHISRILQSNEKVFATTNTVIFLSFLKLLLSPSYYSLPEQDDIMLVVIDTVIVQGMLPKMLRVAEKKIRGSALAPLAREALVALFRCVSACYGHDGILSESLSVGEASASVKVPFQLLCSACGGIVLEEEILCALRDACLHATHSASPEVQCMVVANGISHVLTGLRVFAKTPPTPSSIQSYVPTVVACIQVASLCCVNLPNSWPTLRDFRAYENIVQCVKLVEERLAVLPPLAQDVVDAVASTVDVHVEATSSPAVCRLSMEAENKDGVSRTSERSQRTDTMSKIEMKIASAATKLFSVLKRGSGKVTSTSELGKISNAQRYSRRRSDSSRNIPKPTKVNLDGWRCLCSLSLQCVTPQLQELCLRALAHVLFAPGSSSRMAQLQPEHFIKEFLPRFPQMEAKCQLALVHLLSKSDFLHNVCAFLEVTMIHNSIEDTIITALLELAVTLSIKANSVEKMSTVVRAAEHHAMVHLQRTPAVMTPTLDVAFHIFTTLPLHGNVVSVIDCLIFMSGISCSHTKALKCLELLAVTEHLALLTRRLIAAITTQPKDWKKVLASLCALVTCAPVHPCVVPAYVEGEIFIGLASVLHSLVDIPPSPSKKHPQPAVSRQKYLLSLLLCILSHVVQYDPVYLHEFTETVHFDRFASSLKDLCLESHEHTQIVLDVVTLRRGSTSHGNFLVTRLFEENDIALNSASSEHFEMWLGPYALPVTPVPYVEKALSLFRPEVLRTTELLNVLDGFTRYTFVVPTLSRALLGYLEESHRSDVFKILLNMHFGDGEVLTRFMKYIFHNLDCWAVLSTKFMSVMERLTRCLTLGSTGRFYLLPEQLVILQFNVCFEFSPAVELRPLMLSWGLQSHSSKYTFVITGGSLQVAGIECPCIIVSQRWYAIKVTKEMGSTIRFEIGSREDGTVCALKLDTAAPDGPVKCIVMGSAGAVTHVKNVGVFEGKDKEQTMRLFCYGAVHQETERHSVNTWLRNAIRRDGVNPTTNLPATAAYAARVHGLLFVPRCPHAVLPDLCVAFGFTRIVRAALEDPRALHAFRFLCYHSQYINREGGFFALTGKSFAVAAVKAPELCDTLHECLRITNRDISPLPMLEHVLPQTSLWTTQLFEGLTKSFTTQHVPQLLSTLWFRRLVISVLDASSREVPFSVLSAVSRHLCHLLVLYDFLPSRFSVLLNVVSISFVHPSQHMTHFRNFILWDLCSFLNEGSHAGKLDVALSTCLTCKWFVPFFSPDTHKVTTTLGMYLLTYLLLKVPTFRTHAEKSKFHSAMPTDNLTNNLDVAAIWTAFCTGQVLHLSSPFYKQAQELLCKPFQSPIPVPFLSFILQLLGRACQVQPSQQGLDISLHVYEATKNQRTFQRAVRLVRDDLKHRSNRPTKCLHLLRSLMEHQELITSCGRVENFSSWDSFLTVALCPSSTLSVKHPGVGVVDYEDATGSDFVVVDVVPTANAEPYEADDDVEEEVSQQGLMSRHVPGVLTDEETSPDVPRTELSKVGLDFIRNLANDAIRGNCQQQKLPGLSQEYCAAAVMLHDFMLCYSPDITSEVWRVWYLNQLAKIWLISINEGFAVMKSMVREQRITLVRNAISTVEYIVDRAYGGSCLPIGDFLPLSLSILNNLNSPSALEKAKLVSQIRRYVLYVASPRFHGENPQLVVAMLEEILKLRVVLWQSIAADVDFLKQLSFRYFFFFRTLAEDAKALSTLCKVWRDLLLFMAQDSTLVEKAFSTTLMLGAGRRLDAYHGKLQILLEEEDETRRLGWVWSQFANPSDEGSVLLFMERSCRKACNKQHKEEMIRIGDVLPPASQVYRSKYIKSHGSRQAKSLELWASLKAPEDNQMVLIPITRDDKCDLDSSLGVSVLSMCSMRRLDSIRKTLVYSTVPHLFDDMVYSGPKVIAPTRSLWMIPSCEFSSVSTDLIVPEGISTTPLHRKFLLLELIFPETLITFIGNCYRVAAVDPVSGLVIITQTRLIFISGCTLSEGGDVRFNEDGDGDNLEKGSSGVIGNVVSLVSNVFRGQKKKNLKQHAQIFHQNKCASVVPNTRCEFPLAALESIVHRRYQHFPVAAECSFSFKYRLFLVLISPRFVMQESYRTAFTAAVLSHAPHVVCISHKASNEIKIATKHWSIGLLSNFDYLMTVNEIAGRTPCDLSQYPVFPWTLSDFTSPSLNLSALSSFRDLTKPIGALDPNRAAELTLRYKSLLEAEQPAFHYGSHYSSGAIVLFYNLRVQPFTSYSMAYQGGRLDIADRLFHDIAETWANCSARSTADVKEAIPEFYTQSFFLRNLNHIDLGTRECDGVELSDCVLPPWCHGDPEIFPIAMRLALERDAISATLPAWLDLVFGCHSRGEEAAQRLNTFHYLTYDTGFEKAMAQAKTDEDRNAIVLQIDNFGQAPRKIFSEPHVARAIRCDTRGLSDLRALLSDLDGCNFTLSAFPPEPVLEHFEACGTWHPRTKKDCPFVLNSVMYHYVWCKVSDSIRAISLLADGKTNELYRIPFEAPPCGGCLTCFTASKDGQFLVVASSLGLIYLYVCQNSASQPAVLQNVLCAHEAPVTMLHLCPETFVLCAVSENLQLTLWRLSYTASYHVASFTLDKMPTCMKYDGREGLLYVASGSIFEIFTSEGRCVLCKKYPMETPITAVCPAVFSAMQPRWVALLGHSNGAIDAALLGTLGIDPSSPSLEVDTDNDTEGLVYCVEGTVSIVAGDGSAPSVTSLTVVNDAGLHFAILVGREDGTTRRLTMKEVTK